ncbi:glycine cleavage system protein T [Kiloniella litopenaei]|uniref:Glycine cleavage system protein T n=1 Tax=Kiloniella litopenaei TaxID=1549748 RepID=A0A0M2R8E9_9PROT|nr:FAD-dependent oxidoreductase [Kiloniella litopenaei]KKJ76704.1 glycine cleavage system protein T [Kiloniella litopenaei]
MKSHTRVAVIGGGVVGCSVLYHLTKLGWDDVMLIERSELTSGSTWHAAGGFHTLNADTNMAALQGYTIRLYKELEEITGMSCGLHHVGGVTLASTPERMDFLKAERAKHRYMGLDTEIVGPEEIKKLSPITNIEGVIGALYDPLDGHLDPSGTTHAYAKAAKMAGAEIVLRNPVLELNPRADGSWEVVTKEGTIIAEHIVNAGGLWAREVGEMAGVYMPLHPMEHQYLVTEDAPEVYELDRELPHVMDPEGESYLRQEGRGLCIGFYEQACDAWAERGTPMDFGHELLNNNLDRIGDSLEFAFRRFPVLERVGVKTVINGPFTFAPDGNPLVGPVPGLKNYWSACGVMAGFSQGGGVGLTLAEWMIDGEPSRDVFAMDVARFGDWITPGYTRAKVKENYQRRFSVSYPNEELPVARSHQTTPAYNIWKEQRAVFGAAYGMEAVNYFALEGEPLEETPSFRRSNAFDAVAAECRAVREAVGINEVHNFGKYRITGKGARDWLDVIMAGRIPKPGRLALNPMLSHKGKLIGDFTVSCLNDHEFMVTASFGMQAAHMRWFESNLPSDGSVTIENISTKRIGFQIAGPNARELLSRVAFEDVSAENFKFLDVKETDIGTCRALVQRVSYTGDLGYEIYVPIEQQVALYNTLFDAGQDLGLKPFGMRAMMSLRLEKSFGSWGREFRPDYMPVETGMDRFTAYNKKADFIGKAAAVKEKEEGASRKLCTFVVEAIDADVWGDEPIWHDGKVVGFVTSGGYAHYCQKSVAYGFLPTEIANDGLEVEIEVLGVMLKARMFTETLFDPKAERMIG